MRIRSTRMCTDSHTFRGGKMVSTQSIRNHHSDSMFATEDYVDLSHTDHVKLFENVTNIWEALKQISRYLQFRLKPAVHGRLIGKPFVSGAVFIGAGTVIEHGAMIKGPAWIGEDCEIR